MLRWIRRHGETVVVAGVTALVVSGAPALGHVTKKLGHIVKHLNPLFVNVGEKASDSDLLDGNDATAFLGAGAKAADTELLDGMDSSAFLAANGTAADSELLDGMDSSDFQPRYDRIVVVSTAAELLSAASSAVSGTLIKVEPGNYNLGSNVLQIPQGVDLEGSGMNRTTINRGGFPNDTEGTLVASVNSEIRDLAIRNFGMAPYAVAARVLGTELRRVRLTVLGGSKRERSRRQR